MVGFVGDLRNSIARSVKRLKSLGISAYLADFCGYKTLRLGICYIAKAQKS